MKNLIHLGHMAIICILLAACGQENTTRRNDNAQSNDLNAWYNDPNLNGNWNGQNGQNGTTVTYNPGFDFRFYTLASSLTLGQSIVIMLENIGTDVFDTNSAQIIVGNAFNLNITTNNCTVFLSSGESCEIVANITTTNSATSVQFVATVLNAPGGAQQRAFTLPINGQSGSTTTTTTTTTTTGSGPFTIYDSTKTSGDCMGTWFDGDGDGSSIIGFMVWNSDVSGYLCEFEGPHNGLLTNPNAQLTTDPFPAFYANPDAYCPTTWDYVDHKLAVRYLMEETFFGPRPVTVDDEDGVEICTDYGLFSCNTRETFYPGIGKVLCN